MQYMLQIHNTINSHIFNVPYKIYKSIYPRSILIKFLGFDQSFHVFIFNNYILKVHKSWF